MEHMYCPFCRRDVILEQPRPMWILVVIPLLVATFCIYKAFDTNVIDAQVWSSLAIFLALVSITILMVCRMIIEPQCKYCGHRLSDLISDRPVSMQNNMQSALGQNQSAIQMAPQPSQAQVIPHGPRLMAICQDINIVPGRRVVSFSVWVDNGWFNPSEDRRAHIPVSPGKHTIGYRLILVDPANMTSQVLSEQAEIVVERDCTVAISRNDSNGKLYPFKLKDD